MIRAHATLSILSTARYLPARVATHGHSMGAFVTTRSPRLTAISGGCVPDRRRCPPDGIPFTAAPALAQAALIRTLYQWQHGSDDDVVPLALDQLFEAALDAMAGDEGYVYAGETYGIARHREVLSRIRPCTWPTGCSDPLTLRS